MDGTFVLQAERPEFVDHVIGGLARDVGHDQVTGRFHPRIPYHRQAGDKAGGPKHVRSRLCQRCRRVDAQVQHAAYGGAGEAP